MFRKEGLEVRSVTSRRKEITDPSDIDKLTLMQIAAKYKMAVSTAFIRRQEILLSRRDVS